MLPNLIVIGAPKSGTSSLHHYLGAHPEVYMARPKELQFFNQVGWRDRVDWYAAQFPAASAVRGESSPAYSMDPVIPGVPGRIRELVPGARLVYLVRDPVERLVAHWVEWYALGIEHRPFAEAIADHPAAHNPYACASRYASQLERYLELFPRSQLLVVDRDELMEERARTLARLFAFLGVDPDFGSPEFERVLNPRARKWRLNALGWWLVRHGRADVVRWMHRLPAPARDRALPLVSRRVAEPRLDRGLRDRLGEHFRPEVERLRELTGQRFEAWSV